MSLNSRLTRNSGMLPLLRAILMLPSSTSIMKSGITAVAADCRKHIAGNEGSGSEGLRRRGTQKARDSEGEGLRKQKKSGLRNTFLNAIL